MLAACAHPAWATDVVPKDTGDAAAPAAREEAGANGRAIYRPGDFERFAPRNALDMLRNVPGFVIRAPDNGRGLGQASENVLVNGKRMASKSDSLEDRLSRVPAANVVRIEIVDGAALDVPGLSGQVANIVTQDNGHITGQFNWHSQFRAHYAHPGFAGGDASIKGSSGAIAYTLALSNEQSRGAAGGPTTITGADGALLERRSAVLTSDADRPKVAASLTFDGPGSSTGTFNASYRRQWQRYDDGEVRLPVNGPGLQRGIRMRDRSRDYEIGGDFDFAFGPGRMKLIVLARGETEHYRERVVFFHADGSADTGQLYTKTARTSERIARAEYSLKSGRSDWQLAVEGAFNRLDKTSGLFDLDPAGQFVAVPFPGGVGGVREERYEASLSWGRPLAPDVTVQAVLAAEVSTIRQTRAEAGFTPIARTFRRPKGSLSLAWKPTSGLDLSLNLARKVGQLDFEDFLASADLERTNQNAANLELVPAQSWEAELVANKDLGAWGSTNLRLFHRRFEDYVDLVPLPGGVEGTGNLPRVQSSGVQWTSTFRLEPIGIRGVKIDATVIVRTSSLRDPLTGRKRQIAGYGTREYDLEFRHDVPGSNWAWGGAFYWNRYEPYYRINEVGRDYEGPLFGNLFIENKDVMGLTVKFLAGNLYNGRQRLIRTVYAGPRDVSPELFHENRDRLIGPIFHVYVSGNF